MTCYLNTFEPTFYAHTDTHVHTLLTGLYLASTPGARLFSVAAYTLKKIEKLLKLQQRCGVKKVGIQNKHEHFNSLCTAVSPCGHSEGIKNNNILMLSFVLFFFSSKSRMAVGML